MMLLRPVCVDAVVWSRRAWRRGGGGCMRRVRVASGHIVLVLGRVWFAARYPFLCVQGCLPAMYVWLADPCWSLTDSGGWWVDSPARLSRIATARAVIARRGPRLSRARGARA